MERSKAAEVQHLNKLRNAVQDGDIDDTGTKCSVMKLVTCAVCGGLFGLAGCKSKGMFSLSLMSMIPATSGAFHQSRRCFLRCFVEKGFLTSTLGGAVLGAGMTVCGACPGMVLVQVGARVPSGVYTLTGCLFGALLYGMMDPIVTNILKPRQPYLQNFLHETQSSPYFTISLPLAAMVSMLVFALELFVPWETELQSLGIDTSSYETWPPYIAGMIIGLLQIPLVLAVQDTLGSSSGYCTFISQMLVTRPLCRKLPYLARFRKGVANWWQVVFMTSAVCGAYIASSNQTSPPGVGAVAGFVGGVFMVFSARLAAGCASGHGISGCGLLSLHSLFCIPAIFVGGMITRLFVHGT